MCHFLVQHGHSFITLSKIVNISKVDTNILPFDLCIWFYIPNTRIKYRQTEISIVP